MKQDDAASSLFNDKDNDECKQVNKKKQSKKWKVVLIMFETTFEH